MRRITASTGLLRRHGYGKQAVIGSSASWRQNITFFATALTRRLDLVDLEIEKLLRWSHESVNPGKASDRHQLYGSSQVWFGVRHISLELGQHGTCGDSLRRFRVHSGPKPGW